MNRHLIVGLLLVSAPASAGGGSLASGSRYILALEEKHENSPNRSASRHRAEVLSAYERRLAKDLTPDGAAKLNDDELKTLFDAAHAAAFYSEADSPVRGLETVSAELERRGRSTAEQRRKLYEGYAVTRRFNDARRVRLEHPDDGIAPLPEVLESAAALAAVSRRAYEVSKDGKTLTLTVVPWGAGPQIVMLTSPFCASSKNASADIDSAPQLKAVFAAHALRLQAPKLALSAAELQEGSLVAYKRTDWPGLDLGVTPIFYFYKDGKLRHEVVGWPSVKRKADILTGLARIGLWPPSESSN